jgi:hypothetical protein
VPVVPGLGLVGGNLGAVAHFGGRDSCRAAANSMQKTTPCQLGLTRHPKMANKERLVT